MSQQLMSRSPDLKRLRDEGYDVEVAGSHLLVKNVPYVASDRSIQYGVLVSDLDRAGSVAAPPRNHVAYFHGDHPCDKDGQKLTRLVNGTCNLKVREDIQPQFSFSQKPRTGYPDYYQKMTTYVALLGKHVAAIDPDVTARCEPIIRATEEESVHRYFDTNSSRADILQASKRLSALKVGIVGVGGTGAYVLDLVTKTEVAEIHLFDPDRVSNHTVFRAPGAPSEEEVEGRPLKVRYFAALYDRLHRRVVPHEIAIDTNTVTQLRGLDFVFICVDVAASRRLIVDRLEEWGISFIDSGVGVLVKKDALFGQVRVTTGTSSSIQQNRVHLPLSAEGGPNEYSRNIQIAELNALAATLSVIKWKKLYGFYIDLEKESHSVYQIDGNTLINEAGLCKKNES